MKKKITLEFWQIDTQGEEYKYTGKIVYNEKTKLFSFDGDGEYIFNEFRKGVRFSTLDKNMNRVVKMVTPEKEPVQFLSVIDVMHRGGYFGTKWIEEKA